MISVTGFDGSVRDYEINILRPPHSGGFDRTLDAFPADYRSPLWLLHIRQPAWQFAAFDTGLDWESFIDAQDETDRSLVNASASPAAWVEPGSPVYDGTSWKAATRQVIGHFADRAIFSMRSTFSSLKKWFTTPDSQQDRSGRHHRQFIYGRRQQSGDRLCGNADSSRGDRRRQPYYLAAKIIQRSAAPANHPWPAEHWLVSRVSTISTISGRRPIRRSKNGALINGARFALYGRQPDQREITEDEAVWLLPWNTPERAITGGAIWIAQRYIQIGQDTLYLQKFDLIDDGSLYTHQYAQNIQMAWSEARTTRRAYAGNGLLGEAFVFEIPVFANMRPTGGIALIS